MGTITESDFNMQLKNKDFKKAYFIYGEEKYLVNYYTSELINKIIPGDKNSFNLQDFSDQYFDVDKLNDAVEALPLMANIKCVRVFNLDIEKENQDTIKKLKDIISDIPETTVLIISQTGIDMGKKLSSKWLSFIKFFGKYGEVLNLPVMNKLKLQRQLIRWANKLSCDLSLQNAQVILEKCGDNLLILKQEMEKLCAYANKNEITTEIIQKVLVENVEANVFELTKSISLKKYDRAFEVLNILLDKKEEPAVILSIMASFYIDSYRVKIAEQSGKTIYDVSELFDYKNKMFRLENAKKYLKNIPVDSIRECIDLITDVDSQLKSSKIAPRLLLEELITKISLIF